MHLSVGKERNVHMIQKMMRIVIRSAAILTVVHMTSLNDADSDMICGNVDSCRYDIFNDLDSDKICGDIDSCSNDGTKMTQIVIRSVVMWMHVNMMLKMILTRMVLCGDVDSCRYDAGNDHDSDKLCGDSGFVSFR